ncbi:MAG: holin, BlyA family protein [Lachnospiraceae bacterium]|nr:holin, BlyA family protein [Lachnospiraceae bacterium]MCR4684004.1 holin, BlyA family protein [Lachnospiraceae bacterium]
MNLFNRFMKDESGVGVVEVILILVVLIGLVVIFRDQLTTLMNGIFERIIEDSNAV